MTVGSVRILLASDSPRRRALLPLLGLPADFVVPTIDERLLPGEQPEDAVRRLAAAKASTAAQLSARLVALGADTVVVCQERVLGKPEHADDARFTLRSLRGRTHRVLTAVATLSSGLRLSGLVETQVKLRSYSDSEIEAYVRSDRPLDKAGSYAIQDSDFHPVERITGCYLNVVGLPLCEVARQLARLGMLPAETFLPPCRLCAAGRELLGA